MLRASGINAKYAKFNISKLDYLKTYVPEILYDLINVELNHFGVMVQCDDDYVVLDPTFDEQFMSGIED